MGSISSYIYSYFAQSNANNKNKSSNDIKNKTSSSSFHNQVPKLKLKYFKDLPKEIISINNISVFPSKKLALIANDNVLYIIDDIFQFLIKKENCGKNISIKNDNYFLTYDDNAINIWNFNMENKINLIKKDFIEINDYRIIQLSFKNEIIGLVNKNEELYKIFKLSQCEDECFKENVCIIFKEKIYSFLILETKNNDLFAISQEKKLKIYQINKDTFQLNTTINLDNYYYVRYTKLYDYSNDIFVLFLKDNTPTTGWSFDTLLFFNKIKLNIISKKLLNYYGNDIHFFHKY